MNRSKTRIFIGGMTCVNCQNKIETALLHTAGIETARVSYQNGTADLVYDPDWITLEEIQQVIRDAGYEVLSEKARNKQKPGRAAHILIVIAVLYVLLENSGILNRLVPSQLADTRMGYGMLFVIGLLTSVHCIAMCGGINLSQCIQQKRTETGNGASILGSALLYNLGRVISYTVIGAILGFAGMLIGGGSGVGISLFSSGYFENHCRYFHGSHGNQYAGYFSGTAAFYPTDPTVSGWQGKPEKGWQPTAFYSRDVERAYAVRTAAVDADCSAGFGKSAGGCFFYVYVQSWNGTTDAGTGLVRIVAWKTVYETGHGNRGGSGSGSGACDAVPGIQFVGPSGWDGRKPGRRNPAFGWTEYGS